MTHHPADARPSCMVAALDTIRAAQKLKLEPGTKNQAREQLPELYWSLMAEAAIYAELARADVNVGLIAGGHLAARDERIRENLQRFKAPTEKGKPNPTGSTAAGHGIPTYAGAAHRHPHRAAADAYTYTDKAPASPTIPVVVRVTRGDWAGRTGTVSKVYRDNQPRLVDVALDVLSLTEQPVTITVLPEDVEFVGFFG